MELTTLKIKPRKPRQTIINRAIKEGNAVPIEREAFELQVPKYDVADILTAVENNDQAVLEYLARMINDEVTTAVRAQMNDDEQFPVDEQINIENFDVSALYLNALAAVKVKTRALDITFEDSDFEEFGQDFIRVLLPAYASVKNAELRILNTVNVLISGFKTVRNEPEKMERVKTTLDKFMELADEDTVEKYMDMYDWFCAMQDKRLAAWNKKQAATDVFLD